MKVKSKYKGIALTEVLIFIALVSVLLVCVSKTVGGFRCVNHYYHNKNRCVSAAQAQLNNITVTGKAIEDEIVEQLWPKVKVSIEKTPGTGQWKGLTLVTVTTRADSPIRDARISLSRYVLEQKDN